MVYNLSMKGLSEIDIKRIQGILKTCPYISFAILYGSIVKDDPRPRDIDIAIYLDDYGGLENEISLKLKLGEDFSKFLKKKVDLRILNTAPVEFQLEIVETGILLYCKDRELYSEYLERLSRDALDTIQNRVSLKEAEEEFYAHD